MPAERLPMRQVREVLRLKHVCGRSGHQIAAVVGVSRYTVAEYLRRAAVVGITWPVPPELDDAALERKLFTPPGRRSSAWMLRGGWNASEWEAGFRRNHRLECAGLRTWLS